jgi:hypothetical protein
VDTIDWLHILGEVYNNTADPVSRIEIPVNILDAGGQIVHSDFTFAWLDNLPAGEKTCFEVLMQRPEGGETYEFEEPQYWDGRALPNLTVLNPSGSVIDFGWFQILGQVRNDHGSVVADVMTVGTLYNATGHVVGCDFAYLDSDPPPGGTGNLEMLFVGRDYSDVTSYRIQVDGEPQ